MILGVAIHRPNVGDDLLIKRFLEIGEALYRRIVNGLRDRLNDAGDLPIKRGRRGKWCENQLLEVSRMDQYEIME
ncbi:hypothetical protein K1719_042545 [Acacia pycnantha]|nr:hypothetical protein K1719_042545 [Acacia pycnantha]